MSVSEATLIVKPWWRSGVFYESSGTFSPRDTNIRIGYVSISVLQLLINLHPAILMKGQKGETCG
jgi:hypothetical protein